MIKAKTYEENTFNVYDKIIIDTSSLMHFWALKKFIAEAEDSLLQENKKIFVAKVVWMELVRAYNSHNPEKVERSEKAISLISSHRNIFEIEDEQFFQDEMDLCFADQVLLSNLILDRTDSKILFITNDRMLSRDANEINHQASCRGHKIDTCYISDSGLLKPGYKIPKKEPVIEKVEVIKYITVPAENNRPPIPEKVKNKQSTQVMTNCKSSMPEMAYNKPSPFKTAVKYTFAVTSGFLIGVYGKDFIKYVKKQGGKDNVK